MQRLTLWGSLVRYLKWGPGLFAGLSVIAVCLVFLVFAFLAAWAFVSISLWLNPPLRDKPAPREWRAPFPASWQPGKSVTITGQPVEIISLEEFKVQILDPPCPECAWQLNKGEGECFHRPHRFTPLIDIYTTVLLEGLLLRGICT